MSSDSPWRGAVAFLALAVAVLMLPLTVVGGWVHRNASDTDAWVKAVTPVVGDAEVQQTLGVLLTDRILEQLPNAGSTQRTLDGLLDDPRIPDAVRDRVSSSGASLDSRVRETVTAVVASVVETDAFRAGWAGANRATHEQLITHLESSGPTDGELITLDLGRATEVVRDELATTGLPGIDRLPAIDGSYPLLRSDMLERARPGYQFMDAWAPRAPWILGFCLLVGLVVARRRLTAVAATALAGAVALVVCLPLMSGARELALRASAEADLRSVVGATFDVVTDPLRTQLWTWSVVLAVLGALAAVASAVVRRPRG